MCVRNEERRKDVCICEHVIFESHRKRFITHYSSLFLFSHQSMMMKSISFALFPLSLFSVLWLLLKGIRPLFLRLLLLLFETDVWKAISIEYEWRAWGETAKGVCRKQSEIWYFSPQLLLHVVFLPPFHLSLLAVPSTGPSFVVSQVLRKLDYREISFWNDRLPKSSAWLEHTAHLYTSLPFFHFRLLIIRVQNSPEFRSNKTTDNWNRAYSMTDGLRTRSVRNLNPFITLTTHESKREWDDR